MLLILFQGPQRIQNIEFQKQECFSSQAAFDFLMPQTNLGLVPLSVQSIAAGSQTNDCLSVFELFRKHSITIKILQAFELSN